MNSKKQMLSKTIDIDNSFQVVSNTTNSFMDWMITVCSNKTLKKHYSIAQLYESCLQVSKYEISSLEEIFDIIIELSPEKARKMYNGINKDIDKLIDDNKKMMKACSDENIIDITLDENLKTAINKLDEFKNILLTIADDEPVDEQSEDYKEFISEITTRSHFNNTGDSFEEIFPNR